MSLFRKSVTDCELFAEPRYMRPSFFFTDSAKSTSKQNTLKSKFIGLNKNAINGKRSLRKHKRNTMLQRRNWTKSFNRWKVFESQSQPRCWRISRLIQQTHQSHRRIMNLSCTASFISLPGRETAVF